MKKIIFTVFLMVIVLVVPIVAQGQAEQSDEPVVVSLNTLFHGGDAAAMEMIVEEFNATHDDIQVELTQGGWTDYTAQLNNSVLAGEAPQIATILNFSMSSSLPALLPLNNTPAGDMISLNDFKRDDYVPTVWDIATHNGNQYGIPLDNTMLGIYYNKDIFVKAGLNPEEPPKTLEEFDIAMSAIKDAGYYAFHPGAYGQPRWYRRMWYALLWQNGGQLLNGEKAAFNTNEGIEALKYLVSIRENGYNEPGTNGAAQFGAGELGMMWNGTWHYFSLNDVDFEWGFMGIPKFFEEEKTWGSNHFLAIPKQSKKNEKLIEPAAEVIRWISDNSHTWGIYGGHVPMSREALKNEELLSSRTWEKTLKEFTRMSFEGVYHSLPSHPKINEINNAIQPYIEEAYNGIISPEEALRKAEADVNAVLSM
jgi:multiple sugar transport system substrate-binding protein